jgi:hypothetical protein
MFSLTRESDVSEVLGTQSHLHTGSNRKAVSVQESMRLLDGDERITGTVFGHALLGGSGREDCHSHGASGRTSASPPPRFPKHGEHNYLLHPHDTIRLVSPNFAVASF